MFNHLNTKLFSSQHMSQARVCTSNKQQVTYPFSVCTVTNLKAGPEQASSHRGFRRTCCWIRKACTGYGKLKGLRVISSRLPCGSSKNLHRKVPENLVQLCVDATGVCELLGGLRFATFVSLKLDSPEHPSFLLGSRLRVYVYMWQVFAS